MKPGERVVCPVFPCLVLNILLCYMCLQPTLCFLSGFCCVCHLFVHRDRRPDANSKRRPFTSFCFVRILKSFYFVPVFLCLSRGKEVAARNPTIAHCKRAWEFGGITVSAASPLAASPHARRSQEISAAGGGSPKPADGLPSSRVAAPPGAPFAGDHATGPPLTQCPPARL